MFKNYIYITLFTLLLTISYNFSAIAAEKIETNEIHKEILNINNNDIIWGNSNAPITIIEYSSISCSHCSRFFINTLLEIKQKYIDTGIVKFVHRDFPLNEPAFQASILSHCADKNKYYEFLEVLFKSQKSWAPKKNYIEILENIGKIGGVSAQDYIKCQENEELKNKILKSKLDAIQKLDVRKTPTLFINNKKFEGGVSAEYLSDLIEIEKSNLHNL